MINKITLVFISLFLMTQYVWSMDFKNHPDYELILRTAELGDEMLTSGKIYFTMEFINVDSLSERDNLEIETKEITLEEGQYLIPENYKKTNWLFMFKNNKIFLVEKSIRKYKYGNFFHYAETVYNGDSYSKIRYDSLGMGKTIEPLGDIYGKDITGYYSNPLWYGYFIGKMPVSSFLKGEPFLFFEKTSKDKMNSIEFIKDEKMNNCSCIVVRGKSKENNSSITVWLDKKKLFRPIKIEMLLKGEKIIIENNLKRYSEDLWLPEKIFITKYYFDNQNQQYFQDFIVKLTIHEKTKLNVNLSDNLFETPIPDGSPVGDHRTGETYIKGIKE